MMSTLTLACLRMRLTMSLALEASRMALVAFALNHSMPWMSMRYQKARMALVKSWPRFLEISPVAKTSVPNRMGTR